MVFGSADGHARCLSRGKPSDKSERSRRPARGSYVKARSRWRRCSRFCPVRRAARSPGACSFGACRRRRQSPCKWIEAGACGGRATRPAIHDRRTRSVARRACPRRAAVRSRTRRRAGRIPGLRGGSAADPAGSRFFTLMNLLQTYTINPSCARYDGRGPSGSGEVPLAI